MSNVKRDIRLTVAHLCGYQWDYNGSGGLPIRPDVSGFAQSVLFEDSLGIGLCEEALERVAENDVTMHQDGTITITLIVGERTLFIDVLCGGIVTYVKQFEDGDTAIEGVVRTGWPTVKKSAICELNDLLAWLAQE